MTAFGVLITASVYFFSACHFEENLSSAHTREPSRGGGVCHAVCRGDTEQTLCAAKWDIFLTAARRRGGRHHGAQSGAVTDPTSVPSAAGRQEAGTRGAE